MYSVSLIELIYWFSLSMILVIWLVKRKYPETEDYDEYEETPLDSLTSPKSTPKHSPKNTPKHHHGIQIGSTTLAAK